MFEYKVKTINFENLELETNYLATEGWRVYKILKLDKGVVFDWYDILFERKVK